MIGVQFWMVDELRLRGDELLIFAIIYGLTQGQFEWKVNYEYISKWLGLNNEAIEHILDSLCDKKYIAFGKEHFVHITAKMN